MSHPKLFSPKTVVLVALSVFSYLSGAAQKMGQPYIDSLLVELPKMPDDTNKVKILSDLSFNYRIIDSKKGISYANECLALSEKLDWEKGMGMAHNTLGNNYKANSNYPQALEHFQKALSIYEKLGLKKPTATILMNIGTVYRPLHEYDKAIGYYQKSLTIANEINNKKLQAQLLGNMGVVYFETKKFQKQIEVNQKALLIFQEIGDRGNEAWILSNLGDGYGELGEFERGLASQQQAIVIYDELGDLAYKSTSYISMGKIYSDMAGEGAKSEGEKRALYQKSIEYFKLAQVILTELEDIDYLKDVYLNLAESQEKLGDYKLALENYQTYTLLKDSVFSLDMKESITKLETEREIEVRDREIEIESLKKRTEYIYIGAAVLLLLVIMCFAVAGYLRQRKLNNLLGIEKQKSEELLHNILPEEVAEELKLKGVADAKLYDEATVLFTDFKDFSFVAEQLSPQELVSEIDECFRAFDYIMERHNVEKIKTIGDAYMAVGGLPVANTTNAVDVIYAALEIQRFMDKHSREKAAAGKLSFQIRIGVHSGPVVAGIVGVKKFAYDIWGDTVNTAARMESSGEEGKVNISGPTYEMVKHKFNCTYRGKIAAKNKGEIDMYFVE